MDAFFVPQCLSFTYADFKDFYSNLLELHFEVKRIFDCLHLLAGELKKRKVITMLHLVEGHPSCTDEC